MLKKSTAKEPVEWEPVDEPVKELVTLPAANQLDKRQIKKLFRMFCMYRGSDYSCEVLENCSGCCLREIPWHTQSGQIKDLCHAIWHEGLLNG